MKTTLTPKAIEAARCGDKDCLDMFDAITPGLCLRVTAAKKSWCFVFTPPGGTSRTRMAFGTFPATDLKAARLKVVELRGLLETGKDPRAVVPVAAPKTMAQLIEERLAHEVMGTPDGKGGWRVAPLRTAADTAFRYRKHITPLIGTVVVSDFRIDPHYNKVVDPYKLAGKLRRAGVFHTDLVSLFNFAMRRGVVLYNPLAQTENPDPQNVRKRFLSVAEIVTFWQRLPQAIPLAASVRRILMLCLVTGQRLSEVAGMRRSELDMVSKVWTIPADRVKNGEKYGAHTVPLSDLALEIIRQAMAVNSNRTEWLFPNQSGTAQLRATVIGTTLRRAVDDGALHIAQFTAHDLRRTVGTQMLNKANGLAIPKFDKYLVLNHRSATKGNVSDEVYDQNEYLDEKREALDKWGAFLAQLVGVETGLRVAA